MPFGLTIKACSIRPSDPGLPEVGDDPAQATLRSDVFQQANQTTRLDHPSKLAEGGDLQWVGQYTEQKTRDRCIEKSRRKRKRSHIHLVEPAACCQTGTAGARAFQHRWAGVDA